MLASFPAWACLLAVCLGRGGVATIDDARLDLRVDERAQATASPTPALPKDTPTETAEPRTFVFESDALTLTVRADGARNDSGIVPRVRWEGRTILLDTCVEPNAAQTISPRDRPAARETQFALELCAQTPSSAALLDLRIGAAVTAAIDAAGDLVVSMEDRLVRVPAPHAWQRSPSGLVELPIAFDPTDPSRIVFAIEGADALAPIYLCCGEWDANGLLSLPPAPVGPTAPGTFDLTTPVDGSTPIPLFTGLIFAWTDSTAEEGYTFELATSPAFTTLLDSQDLAVDTVATSFSTATLSPTTTYYWRVTANNATGSTPASNAPFSFVGFGSGPGGGIGTGPFGTDAGSAHCFIATAAYGSPMASEVGTLRSFRDRVLLRSGVGQFLVRQYYAHSPPIAAAIAADPNRRQVVRAGLWPVVGLARVSLWSLDHPLAAGMLAVGLFAMARWSLRSLLRKRSGMQKPALNV